MPACYTAASPGTSMSSATPMNVISQLLVAGTYLVWGQVDYSLAAATLSEARCGVSLSSASMPTQPGGSGLGPDSLCVVPLSVTLLTNTLSIQVNPTTLVITVPTEVYLCAQCTFSVGTVSVYGTLFAIAISGTNYNLVPS